MYRKKRALSRARMGSVLARLPFVVVVVVPLTGFVGEHRLAHRTRPHAQRRRRQLSGLRMAGQMLAQRALVDVVLAAHRTRMVGRAPFG